MNKPEDKDNWYDAAVTRALGRVSGPIMVGLCIWVLNTLNQTNKSVDTLTAIVAGKVETLTAKVDDTNRRVDKLEDRIDSAQASADPPKRMGGI